MHSSDRALPRAPRAYLSNWPAILVASLGCSNPAPSDEQLTSSAGQSATAGSSGVGGGSSGSSAGESSTAGRGGAGTPGSAGRASGGDGGSAGAPIARPPNVIVLMVDDLGYSDLGSFGGEIHTPHIDGLAAAGLRFTNFYNSSRCSPTRASLLTGLYPHRVNLAQNGRDLGRNGLTIAEGLKGAGYNTALSGKWHLSRTPELPNAQNQLAWLNHQLDPGLPFSPDLQSYPVGRGFDRHFGIVWGVASYFDPFSLVDGTTPIDSVPEDFYLTSEISKKTVSYIEDFAARPEPFFIYVAFTAPHFPLQALPEDIAKYEGVYDAGWAPIRAARYRRQLDMGLFNEGNTPLPASTGNDWSTLTTPQKLFLSNTMQTHAAMVDRVDQGVGDILSALESSGELDNTLVIFLSDNGASAEIHPTPGYDRQSETREGEPVVYCGGQAACAYSQPGDEKTYAYIGPSWANALNTPFRQYKGDSFRGGNTTPFIVHWPAGLKTEPGSITEQPAHVIDVLPTVLDLAGVDYPSSYEGNTLSSLDGASLAPVIAGEQREPHEHLFFEHEGGAAVIEGSYKLVKPKGSESWELYDLATDRSETKNLAAAQAARAASMNAAWQAWYDSVPH